ncbi:hypothetical protein [Curtobacterium sp. 24E2]|nr:hypothetical protein JN350_02385 [Curtobacterium sp. 24E2]
MYSIISLAVPTFGTALAFEVGALDEAWLLVSIGLTAVAAGILALGVLPEQREVLRGNGTERSPRKLAAEARRPGRPVQPGVGRRRRPHGRAARRLTAPGLSALAAPPPGVDRAR